MSIRAIFPLFWTWSIWSWIPEGFWEELQNVEGRSSRHWISGYWLSDRHDFWKASFEASDWRHNLWLAVSSALLLEYTDPNLRSSYWLNQDSFTFPILKRIELVYPIRKSKLSNQLLNGLQLIHQDRLDIKHSIVFQGELQLRNLLFHLNQLHILYHPEVNMQAIRRIHFLLQGGEIQEVRHHQYLSICDDDMFDAIVVFFMFLLGHEQILLLKEDGLYLVDLVVR